MVRARDDMRLLVGMDSSGLGHPLRTDSAGRLEVVSERTVHSARVYHSADQSVGNAVWGALAFDSEDTDSEGMHDNSTHNSRLTVVHAGTYLLGGCIQFAVNVTGIRGVSLRLNGTTYLAYMRTAAFATYAVEVAISMLKALAVGDYVELMAFQSSGSSLNVLTAQASPVFWAVRL